jgi:hypothetical protein
VPAQRTASRPALRLVQERKLAELIALPEDGAVLEASGVLARGRDCFVIFDNLRRVARIDRSLAPGSSRHGWVGPARSGEGYEDIAYSPHQRRYFLLVEAEKHPDGTFKAVIEERDEEFRSRGRHWVDFPFEERNTGFEGLAAVRFRGHDYLLALCEGNRCRAGKKGRRPGGGRIHVIERQGTVWRPVATVKLPRSVEFEDYSALAIRGERIAVASQRASRLWLGTLRRGDWTIAGAGRQYDFPRTRRGKLLYSTVEGISWLPDGTLVAVSDLTKQQHPGRCAAKDQSIHVFRIPGSPFRRR